MTHKQTLTYFISKDFEGSYLTLPFDVPEGTAEFHLNYHYPAFHETQVPADHGDFLSRQRINTIDLGLIGPDGRQVGASGSDKNNISISATSATPGYHPRPLIPGAWRIIIGAYKVAPQGVTVSYELTFVPKERKLLIGDIHTHTTASDGVLTLPELAAHAKRHNLEFLAITDHNQSTPSEVLDSVAETAGITLIPGIEWTHYQGHANFLGVDQPYDPPFFTHTPEEARSRFLSARERGALIVINHPFDESCGFTYDLNTIPFDCIEIWNGPMRESNLRAVGLWHSLLVSGKRIPAVGGSDYHRDNLFQILGGPCMGVYALSKSPGDILTAIRKGHSFITFAPVGPHLDMRVGDDAIMGDALPWQAGQTIQISARKLNKGDILRVITSDQQIDLFQAPSDGEANLNYAVPSPGFARVEIYRTFLPGLPPLPALISNPIYFE